MIAQGYFARDDQFELLDGLIVKKIARDPIHDACLAGGHRELGRHLPPGWHVRVQSAVTTGDSEPEPDLAIVRGKEFDYVSRHPGPSDVALIIEVANTSLIDDRNWKGEIYARAGFVAYWIINLTSALIEVYTEPSGPNPAPSYRRRQDYAVGESIPLSIGGAAVSPVAVADLFPLAQP